MIIHELLRRGGITMDCVADTAVIARITLQLDGSAYLRCTGIEAPAQSGIVATMQRLSAQLTAALATLASVRSVIDASVAIVSLAAAIAAEITARTSFLALLQPAVIVLFYAAMIPLRRRLLRIVLRWALRRATRQLM